MSEPKITLCPPGPEPVRYTASCKEMGVLLQNSPNADLTIDERRELLEFAAKAAGIGPLSWIETDGTKIVTNLRWNPLNDDGDALRLAVKLELMDEVSVMNAQYESDDPLAATRRAIVRAAAELGRSMK